MDLEQKFEIIAEEEPNFYFVKNNKDWLCRIQLNGELSNKKQEEIINLMIGSLNFYFAIKKKIKEKFDNYDSTGND